MTIQPWRATCIQTRSKLAVKATDRTGACATINENIAPLEPEELARRRFVQAIFPHIRNFYVDWRLPKPEPFYAVHGMR